MISLLTRSFFERPTLVVAQELIGKRLIFRQHEGIIVETEAYIGQDDPACHAARGRTPRTSVMFGAAGYSYIYFIYGMYHCLNVVTEKEGFPAAVLIRGIRMVSPPFLFLNGPGKVCRHLNLNLSHNHQDMTTSPHFCMMDAQESLSFVATPRIGISKGKDKFWRFVVT